MARRCKGSYQYFYCFTIEICKFEVKVEVEVELEVKVDSKVKAKAKVEHKGLQGYFGSKMN